MQVDGLFNQNGNILISDQFNNRVVEVTDRGRIVWSYGLGPTNFTTLSIIGVNDAQRVGDHTLMAGTGIPADTVPQAPNGIVDNRVILVDKQGRIVWQYGQFGQSGLGFDLLNVPVQCTFVPDEDHKHRKHCDQDSSDDDHKHRRHRKHNNVLNGTVLITDQGNNRIIQVNHDKEIIWQYPGSNTNPSDQLSSPNSAEKLNNGHVLIADQGNNRAIIVNRQNKVVKVFTAGGTLGACAFASHLHNGHILLTDAGNSRIVEVHENDHIVWQYLTNAESLSIPAPLPTRGLRLKNGDTIISDQFNNRVIIINKANVIVAYYGLPLTGGTDPIGTNTGYDVRTVQLGLYSPYDAKVIGDYTGLTPPKDK